MNEHRDVFQWKEIRGCPGRYTLKSGEHQQTPPAQLLSAALELERLQVHATRHEVQGKDPMVVSQLTDGGGLLTYCKPAGVYVHTLNTTSGLERKTKALGVATHCAAHTPPPLHASSAIPTEL